MVGSIGGIVLGLVVGLRHAFEPDHLTAVSTLVTETGGARRGAMLGAIWGVGHTVAVLAVGVILVIAGVALPERLAAGFELAVAAMLIGLGIRALVIASRRDEPASRPHHGRAASVGLLHGLAGSGALTALVFAELPGTAERISYLAMFGVGSVIGMAAVSGLAGASLGRLGRGRHHLAVATGALSIVVGIVWSVPVMGALA